MVTVATRNFRMVDHLLAAPAAPAARMAQTLGAPEARMFLRYLSSELNRWYFEIWEKVQLILAAAVTALLLIQQSRSRLALALSLVLIAIILIERLALTPEIVRLGRLIDFAGPDAPVAERSTFWRYHNWYSGLEITKMLMIASLGWFLQRVDRGVTDSAPRSNHN